VILVHVAEPLVTGHPPGVYRAIAYRYDPREKYTLFDERGEPICNEYRQNTTPVFYGYVIPEGVWRIDENRVCGFAGEIAYIRQRRAAGHGPDVADWRAMVGRPSATRLLEVLEQVTQDVRSGWPQQDAHSALKRLCDDVALRQEAARDILAGAGWPYAMVPGDPRAGGTNDQVYVLLCWETWPTRKVGSVVRALKRAQAKLRQEIELTTPPAVAALEVL
jgi:hypothetical protein